LISEQSNMIEAATASADSPRRHGYEDRVRRVLGTDVRDVVDRGRERRT
jgi:hypothetical protein